MTTSPKVSVVIPTYNHRAYVLETLDSVFAQTFTDYEVIVVNDGSPDDTDEVLRPFVEAGRIRYYKQANQGQAFARNRGITEARGEFIALLDDDDLWPPDKLEWQIAVAANSPHRSMIVGQSSCLNSHTGEEYGPEHIDTTENHNFLARNSIRSPGQTLIPRELLVEIGGFNTTLWGVDDWELYIRIARDYDVIYLSKLALRYRYHDGNASRHFRRMYQNGLAVYRMYASSVPPRQKAVVESSRRLFAKQTAIVGLDQALHSARVRQQMRTWQALFDVAFIAPLSLFSRKTIICMFTLIAPTWLVAQIKTVVTSVKKLRF